VRFVDIVSRFGDTTLRITPMRHPWDAESRQPAWDMQLTGPELDVSSRYVEDFETTQTLAEFFAELAEEYRGWDGDKTWTAAAGEMTIRATHDQINTTRLHVTMTGGMEPRWTASCDLHIDPLRCAQVASNLALYGEELFGDDWDHEAEPVRRDPRKLAREPIKRIGTPDPQ
jgi:hypothetical protein